MANKSKKKKSPNKKPSAKPVDTAAKETKAEDVVENTTEVKAETKPQTKPTSKKADGAKAKEKKAEPKKPEGKGKKVLRSIGQFFKDLKSECKKIVWTSRSQTWKNTWTVLLIVVLIGIVIWLADFGLTELRQLLYDAASKTEAETSFLTVLSSLGL